MDRFAYWLLRDVTSDCDPRTRGQEEQTAEQSVETKTVTAINDPVERIVADALTRAGVPFTTGDENAAGLDFYLPDHDLYIEVKQFHSPRIEEQMSRAANVVAVQGRAAAEWLATRIAAVPLKPS